MKYLLASAAVALALAATTAAHATCVSSLPVVAPDPSGGTTCAITAGAATVHVVLAYKAAADVDLIVDGVNMLSNLAVPGTEFALTGEIPGAVIPFVWKNNTTGDMFQAGVAASDGDQHVYVESSYTDFQTDPPRVFLTQADLGAAYGVMAGIAPIGDWTFVGLEDLLKNQSSDFDGNDIVVGILGDVQPTQHTTGLAEPAMGAIFGLALLAVGAIGERRARGLMR